VNSLLVSKSLAIGVRREEKHNRTKYLPNKSLCSAKEVISSDQL
jgi:hypothetical protein